MVSALDVPRVATRYGEEQVNLSGSGGEVTRGGYYSSETRVSREQAIKTVENLFSRRSWLFSSRFDELARARRRWLALANRDHLQAMDLLYLQFRAGRWIAANRAAIAAHGMYLHPLLDHAFVRRVLEFPVEHRYSERAAHDLVRRLNPRISELPLAFRRWRCDTEPSEGTSGHAAWMRRAPVVMDKTVTAPDWRKSLPGSLRDLIRAVLYSTVIGVVVYTLLQVVFIGAMPAKYLGSGWAGMATVFAAEDLKHGRRVAIKVLSPELSSSIDADRFKREIQIAARLSHPHILPVFDSDVVGSVVFTRIPR